MPDRCPVLRPVSVSVLAVLALILALAPAAVAQLADGQPAFRSDARRTGRSVYVGTHEPSVSWTVATGGFVLSSPAVVGGETIYAGSFDNSFYAMSRSGSVLWSYETCGPISSSAAVARDGSVYVGSQDCNLYAFESSGSQRWVLPVGQAVGLGPAAVYSSPIISPSGALYFSDEQGRLYSVNPASGAVNWHRALGSGTLSSPAVGDDGRIYIGSSDGILRAFDADGSPVWAFQGQGQMSATPSIGDDGTIYIGTLSGALYAVNPNGYLRWTYYAPPSISSSVGIAQDGTLYFGSYDGYLHAVRPNGTRKWTHFVGYPVSASPTIDAEGSVYFGTHSGYLRSLDPGGSVRWSIYIGSKIHSSCAIGRTGTIYFGAYDNRVYAIGSVPEPSSLAQLMLLCTAGGLALRRYRRGVFRL